MDVEDEGASHVRNRQPFEHAGERQDKDGPGYVSFSLCSLSKTNTTTTTPTGESRCEQQDQQARDAVSGRSVGAVDV